MKIVNGKIVEATRAELLDYFMKHVGGDSFGAFVWRCIENGTKVIDKKEGGDK